MRWLLWKEYRQNWAIFWVMGLLWLLPFVIASIVMWHEQTHVTGLYEGGITWTQVWAEALCEASIGSTGCSCFILVLLSGSVIAGERADRSAEFQAYLPIPRRKIVLAKIVLIVSAAVALWVPNLALQWYTVNRPIIFHSNFDRELFHTIDPMMALVGVTACCVAWCLSAITRSVLVAAGVGLASPAMVLLPIAFFADYDRPSNSALLAIFTLVCLVLAASGFIIGTWIALRRVEP